MVNFTRLFTINEMISIFTSQAFCSWAVIFHLRRPMAFLSLSLYNTPRLAPNINVIFRGPGDFPVRYSNSDTSWNALHRHSGRFMVDTVILSSNMTSTSHECSMKFWPSTSYNDFPTDQTFHSFHDLDTELDFHEWFPSNICNGCGRPAGNAYPSGHLVPSLIGTSVWPICWDKFSQTRRVFFRFLILNISRYFLSQFRFEPMILG